MDIKIENASVAVLNMMTEAEMADWRIQQGANVIFHRAAYWEEIRPGFYQPIHFMSRLTAEQANHPHRFSWGFRAALCEKDAIYANGSIPVHLLSDVANYDINSLPQKRRTELRKCYKQVKIIQISSPELLQEQGYEVVCSSLNRTKHKNPPSRANYLASLTKYTTDKYRLILAAMIGDRLGGYIDGYAVNGTAYMISGYYKHEFMNTNLVSGLNFEFVQICRRHSGIREIVDGLHSREVPSLNFNKHKVGFSVQYIPAKYRMNAVIGTFIRWHQPNVYYRLTGR